MNGQSCDLALNIPQRHIDRADGIRRRPSVLPPHIPPNRPAIQRIPPHHNRLQKLHQRRRIVIRPLTRRPQKSIAAHPPIRLHRHYPQQRIPAEPRMRISEPVLRLPIEHRNLDVGYLHCVASLSLCGFGCMRDARFAMPPCSASRRQPIARLSHRAMLYAQGNYFKSCAKSRRSSGARKACFVAGSA